MMRSTHPALRALFAIVILGTSASCLDPLVDDDVVGPELVLAPGTTVPNSEDDPMVAAKIAAEDQIEGDVVPIISGFRGGEPVFYWDFGTAPADVQPLELLVEADPEGSFVLPDGRRFAGVGHPPVWNVVPGDPAYSPFWIVRLVPVTDAWNGEVLPSFDAIEQARERGLVSEAIATDIVINCPVIPENVRLEMPDGTLAEPSVAYYRGMRVYYHDVGVVEMIDESRVGTETRYLLRREGGEPLSEPWRGVDLNGDGDNTDTNDLFPAAERTDALHRSVELLVGADTISIDSGGDPVEYDDLADLLTADGTPRVGMVLGMRPLDDEVCNCPIAP